MENTTEASKKSLIYVIVAFTITCFRAIRHTYRFEFNGNARNLAVFGLNGFGKSSIVDALEFVMSKFGSIERLGAEEKLNRNEAGPDALKNVYADEKNEKASVHVVYEKLMGVQAFDKKSSKQKKKPNAKNMNVDLDKVELTRFVKGEAQQSSTEFDDLVSKINVSPLIRGDELKVLLSHTSATQRFETVVESLGRIELFDN